MRSRQMFLECGPLSEGPTTQGTLVRFQLQMHVPNVSVYRTEAGEDLVAVWAFLTRVFRRVNSLLQSYP